MTRETHFPSINELSDYHRKKIDELRNRAIHDLAVYPEYDTDFSLLRWLLGYDYDIGTLFCCYQNSRIFRYQEDGLFLRGIELG